MSVLSECLCGRFRSKHHGKRSHTEDYSHGLSWAFNIVAGTKKWSIHFLNSTALLSVFIVTIVTRRAAGLWLVLFMQYLAKYEFSSCTCLWPKIWVVLESHYLKRCNSLTIKASCYHFMKYKHHISVMGSLFLTELLLSICKVACYC